MRAILILLMAALTIRAGAQEREIVAANDLKAAGHFVAALAALADCPLTTEVRAARFGVQIDYAKALRLAGDPTAALAILGAMNPDDAPTRKQMIGKERGRCESLLLSVGGKIATAKNQRLAGDAKAAASTIASIGDAGTEQQRATIGKEKKRIYQALAKGAQNRADLESALAALPADVAKEGPGGAALVAAKSLPGEPQTADEIGKAIDVVALGKRVPGPALEEWGLERLRAVAPDNEELWKNRQAAFQRMNLALKDGDWKTFDAMVARAAKENYLLAQYLQIVAEWSKGEYEKVVALAEEYNSTVAPDEVAGGYHRESHLWADVYRWRAEKALNRPDDAAKTAARITAEWPDSAWAKAVSR